MFKRFAADALGLSDIGSIIKPADFDKVDADDYLFHEDGEKIFFLIKSKKDEYCFTNLALIHVDGESAVSSKRTIKRYDYLSERIQSVMIETAGTVDLDVELKFVIGGKPFSIDIKKTFLEQVKDIYKSLIGISKIQHLEELKRANALKVLDMTASMYKIANPASPEHITQQYTGTLDTLNALMLETYMTHDYSAVFSKYVQA
ncbi:MULTISPECIES: PH domain-containing protein [Pseudomonas]|uniref:PH domain-containing protein n=1 Tax=Pseudomonas TaxID=286 RepID=UPI001C60DC4A|nr:MULTISPECIES: PH domain-containing protein [Pseudomonas]MBW5414490.1 PH domain-containing protein [Pseudomonas sp. MAG002Y]MCG7371671.1 PH domain-containing protein [Pseudomonas luteola]